MAIGPCVVDRINQPADGGRTPQSGDLLVVRPAAGRRTETRASQSGGPWGNGMTVETILPPATREKSPPQAAPEVLAAPVVYRSFQLPPWWGRMKRWLRPGFMLGLFLYVLFP